MSYTYSDVDSTSDPAGAVEWQERVDRWPQVRAYKSRVLELMAGAERVLDVGCGPGGDVLAVGADRCVGLDRSLAMCRAAAAKGATACRADVHRLPFPDGRFGRPREWVPEHFGNRRDEGRHVLAEDDGEGKILQRDKRFWNDGFGQRHGVGQQHGGGFLLDRVKTLRRDIGYRNGRLISSLPARLAALGLADVSVDPFPLSLTDPDDAFGLPGWPRLWRNQGGFSDGDLLEWERGVEGSRERGFLYSLIYFVVSAVR